METIDLLGAWIRDKKEPMLIIIYGETYDSQCKDPFRVRVRKISADPHCTFTIPKKECMEIGIIKNDKK